METFAVVEVTFGRFEKLGLELFNVLALCLCSLELCLVRTVLVVGAKEMIPPAERSGIIVGERHVMEIVVICTRPEWQNVLERPREVVARVGVDGLEEAEGDPDVHGDDMEVSRVHCPEDWTAECAEGKDERLERVGILCRETKGCAVLVVELVNVAVERTIVERLVGDKVVEIFKDEEAGHLEGNGGVVWEGDLPRLHSEEFGERMEEPDSWEFNGKVREQDEFGALPLLLLARHLVWLELPTTEIGNRINNDPGNTASKVDDLMQDETEHSSCNYRVSKV